MLANAADRIATERQQTILALRNEIGELAMSLSERIVHDSLSKDARQRKLVADFIAGVGATEEMEAEHAGTAAVDPA
jgi:F-type H+-transporting ATPase subunit b